MADKPPKKQVVAVVTPVQPQRRQLTPLRQDQIRGDGGVGDFEMWVQNFWFQDSGHFQSHTAAEDCGKQLGSYVVKHGGIDGKNIDKFVSYIQDEYFQGAPKCFVSAGACRHFCGEIRKYVEVDGSIAKRQDVLRPSQKSNKN